ncbi:SAM-dependent DNA methyltransferase [Streptococcus anginosus]|uniref:Eco57I restriction-modification methylase domain-containing protein n=1 Tax=Streptococcus anginosus TaxID=1328 RepID=UPI001C8B3FBE|nr:N-6 DNA methylase [Streptococcus anginosus]MBX9076560.1 SAM-dependent DNA methyltransferase [Streptococcus anginosus]
MLVIDDLLKEFRSRTLNTEDDVKLYAYSDIFSPIQKKYAPNTIFQSERTFVKGGRADGTIANLVIEYKKYNHFGKQKGEHEALFGREQNKRDSGLYQYILNSIVGNEINDSILDTFGIGFDGNEWIFARFTKAIDKKKIDLTRTRFEGIYNNTEIECPYEFTWKKLSFRDGLEQLILLFNSTEKTKISKESLSAVFNPKNPKISKGIMTIYKIMDSQLLLDGNQRTKTLYYEWDRTFGAMFGKEEQETEFNETSESIRKLYGVQDLIDIDSKLFLFSTQTYFNIFLKLLIDSFINKMINPALVNNFKPNWSDIISLFEGRNTKNSEIISNFFEIHYYEWFTYLYDKSDTSEMLKIIQDIYVMLNNFDLATYKLRPESVQDVLQEIYMTLIPDQIRHLLGEYFSPDWIVEHSLDRVKYFGELNKKIIDPTCGSGAFVIQALKRTIQSEANSINFEKAKIISNNIVGFDLNPISAVSAKANYILTLLSSVEEKFSDFPSPLSIPIYISDSVLSPIVYSEEDRETFKAQTSVGDFIIPKFESFEEGSKFLDDISYSIEKDRPFSVFESLVLNKLKLSETQSRAVAEMYEDMIRYHRSAQDSFWGRILKNSFAPVMLKQKFDFVVGNPPWIAWKSMSKIYREGTLEVWKSYGIFEKNAYDKKTTHDDFGMAVTYVSLDQYLKENGKMYFLLPWTFLKSTKGGEGFRKLSITRNKQQIPVKITLVDDYNDIQIFKPKHTVRTIGVLFEKGSQMKYPMNSWYEWSYKEKRSFEAHFGWNQVVKYIENRRLFAKPIDESDLQSSWLTLEPGEIAIVNKVLLNGAPAEYKGRKGIEPAGAKGIYILKHPHKNEDGTLNIINDISRQRRKDLKSKGEQKGNIESTFVYPMLGGRNIQRWKVVSNEFMLVPHKVDTPYGLKEDILADEAPKTYEWLEYYKDGLLASRIQSGKFYNPETQPWYRLDNVGDYTFSDYKVIWKEQASSFAAVAIGKYSTLPQSDLEIFGGEDKAVVVDSKVLMLATDTMDEAYYISAILNSKSIRDIIDAYSVGLNRGVDVLKNIKIPKYDSSIALHVQISELSKRIHEKAKSDSSTEMLEGELDNLVKSLY